MMMPISFILLANKKKWRMDPLGVGITITVSLDIHSFVLSLDIHSFVQQKKSRNRSLGHQDYDYCLCTFILLSDKKNEEYVPWASRLRLLSLDIRSFVQQMKRGICPLGIGIGIIVSTITFVNRLCQHPSPFYVPLGTITSPPSTHCFYHLSPCLSYP